MFSDALSEWKHDLAEASAPARLAVGSRRCDATPAPTARFVLVTEDGLEVKSEDSQKFNGIRATLEVTGGKYMFEVPGRELQGTVG